MGYFESLIFVCDFMTSSATNSSTMVTINLCCQGIIMSITVHTHKHKHTAWGSSGPGEDQYDSEWAQQVLYIGPPVGL